MYVEIIGSLETRADISNIGIPIGWVSVDENGVWGWDGNSGDVLDEGCEGTDIVGYIGGKTWYENTSKNWKFKISYITVQG